MHPMMTFVLAVLAPEGPAVTPSNPTVPQEDLRRIRAAAPAEAPAKPKTPRKLLVYSRATHYRHDSIPWGAQAIRILGEKTGAYVALLSDDPAMFDRDKLGQFDAVLFNNNCQSGIEAPMRRENLLTFVRGGRGLVGIHSASHSPDWPEFIDMLGGFSVNHPWNAGSKVVVKIEDPNHPVAKPLGRQFFVITDEIFQFRDYSRQTLRVLASLDTERTDMAKPGIFRTDGDFGLSWVRSYGKGRVFYCEFGHQKEVYWNPTILRHYLAGIQFALGDLQADTTPSAKLTHTHR
jgi:type 1 glutamine amidotransferase